MWREQGQNYRNCQVAHVLSACEKEQETKRFTSLCYVWGKVRDQNALILLDPRSTHNFISQELAQHLGIHTKELGLPLQEMRAFEGEEVLVTPMIGKLCLHINNYSNNEDFYESPL